MKRFFEITVFELRHFLRSPFKMVSLVLFIAAGFYACQNGYSLYRTHLSEITAIKKNNDDYVNKMILQYEEIEKGTEKARSRRDPSDPYWAIWNVPSYVFKYPSKLMPFSIGQAEQYGYTKRISNWSTIFDSDMAEEIANPERLAVGTLDFSFVFIYLTPILIIIMLFNVGGLEKDLNFDQLIHVTNISKSQWLTARFSFYFILLFLLIILMMLPYSFLLEVFKTDGITFLRLLLVKLGYIFFWFLVFFIINYFGKGSPDQSLKMISAWLLFCIIIPGGVHQLTSLKFPTNYMTDYLDVRRDNKNNFFEFSNESLRDTLISSFPYLESTVHASDSIPTKPILNKSVSALVNVLNKNAAKKVKISAEQRNQFIINSYIINPVIYFQNQINRETKTDYFAYEEYKNKIQSMIDGKIHLILNDCWNKEIVDKQKYISYVESLKLQ
mgnify:FL=1